VSLGAVRPRSCVLILISTRGSRPCNHSSPAAVHFHHAIAPQSAIFGGPGKFAERMVSPGAWAVAVGVRRCQRRPSGRLPGTVRRSVKIGGGIVWWAVSKINTSGTTHITARRPVDGRATPLSSWKERSPMDPKFNLHEYELSVHEVHRNLPPSLLYEHAI